MCGQDRGRQGRVGGSDLAGETGDGRLLGVTGSRVEFEPGYFQPIKRAAISRRPMPAPYREFEQPRAYALHRMQGRARSGFVIGVTVAAPGNEYRIAFAQIVQQPLAEQGFVRGKFADRNFRLPATLRMPEGTQVSGAHPDDRDPQLLGATVDKLVGDLGWELELRVRGVFARWPALVGDEVGAHSTPETFTDGKLVVRTDSTAWATQLKLLAPTVVRRLNEELGPATVVAMDVVGPHLPSWKKGRRSTRDGRGPRDTYG